MANYLTTDTELTSIANAIRTKGGTNTQLTFPSGFVSAINAISTGGATQEVAATTYANNNGTKTSVNLSAITGGYYEGELDTAGTVYSYLSNNNVQYGMLSDTNGIVIWKGKLMAWSYTNDTSYTYYVHSGGGILSQYAERMYEDIETDPETGDEVHISHTEYYVEITTDPHAAILYLSTTAF